MLGVRHGAAEEVSEREKGEGRRKGKKEGRRKKARKEIGGECE